MLEVELEGGIHAALVQLEELDLSLEETVAQGLAVAAPTAAPACQKPPGSPYVDLYGLPSVLIQVGPEEMLLDNAVRMTGAARSAGASVEPRSWPAMNHASHLFVPRFADGLDAP